MEFVDLKAQQRRIEPVLRARLDRVLEHSQYINGPEVAELETRLADLARVPHAIGCSSGTDALLMALMAFGVGSGDAVFTSTYSFVATAEVIVLLGATPVLVDIDPISYNIDTDLLLAAITRVRQEGQLRPCGIIPVDLFGHPAEYESICSIADEEELFVLADAAQSFGATYHGQPVGSLGDIAATSFFPAKPLGCYGDGGMVFTHDPELHKRVRSISAHGAGKSKYDTERIGLNARLDTLQAAVLLAKIDVFADEIMSRERISRRYSDELADVCEVARVADGVTSAWAQYAIMHPQRDDLRMDLNQRGIPTAIYYPKPIHAHPTYTRFAGVGDYPVADRASSQILCLPVHPYLRADDQSSVIEAVRDACRRVA